MSGLRKLIKFLIDILILNAAIIISFWAFKLKINEYFLTIFNLVFASVYLLLKTYETSWRFTGVKDLLQIFFINLFVSIISTLILLVLGRRFGRVTVLIFSFSLIGHLVARFAFVLTRLKGILQEDNDIEKERVLIYGAGESGVLLVKEAFINPKFPYKIIGFLDDDTNKLNGKVYGLKVFGGLKDLKKIAEEREVSKIVVCMPSANRQKTAKILNEINQIQGLSAKILSNLDSLIGNTNISSQLRNIKLEDLLGRDEIQINTKEVSHFIEDKTIFVTGGGGSIGSELINQIAKFNPRKIVNIEINENASYLMELELKRTYPNLDYQTEIASVRDINKLEKLFEKYQPDILFHAAAHKHVPLMETNPEEAIKNNIFGTKNVAECALKYNLERVVLISTDKAVNPTNVMGATKRVCEMIFQKFSEKSQSTKFMAVRFGNVLGSNGSVIPIFSKLIEEGKNLTLTHKDIIRYFMTIPEAAQLVIEAGAIGNGGEIFILDMGEPVKIYDLAKNMIKLSGSNVGIDIVGLRPGEKLFEELLYDVNSSTKTTNNKIYITNMENEKVPVNIEDYYEKLNDLAIKQNHKEMRRTLADIIGTFKGRVE